MARHGRARINWRYEMVTGKWMKPLVPALLRLIADSIESGQFDIDGVHLATIGKLHQELFLVYNFGKHHQLADLSTPTVQGPNG